MSANTPRPLHLVTSPTSTTTDVFSSPTPPSSFRNSKRYSMIVPTPTCSSPISSSSKATIAQTKASRRQSSIGYFPPDLTENSRRGSLIRRNSIGALNDGSAETSGRVGSWANSRDRMSTVSLPASSGEEADSKPETPLRERPPLTLTEKHADLLRFIAQKESKCLELRSQLAIHEAELVELKRKWQRIVNKGLERGLHSAPLSGSGDASSVVLDGIKEGVQGVSRLLAASFSTSNVTSPNTPASVPSDHSIKSRPRPPSLIRKAHSAKESQSSISTNATSRSGNTTGRYSQSSMSSFGEETGGNLEEEEKEGDHNDDSNIQILMVRDTGATPTMSPNPEFHQQKQKQNVLSPSLSPKKRTNTNDITLPAPTSLEGEPDGHTWTSNVQSTTTRAHRRKSREVGRLDFEHLDFSSLSPSVLLSPPSMSRSNTTSPGSSPRLGGSRSTTAYIDSMNGGNSDVTASRSSSNLDGLPPMSSIPGLGSMAAGVVSPPMSLWMDSMGKKLGQLQRSSTFTNSQKRASLLLSDMSNSFINVLAPSTPTVTSNTTNNNNSAGALNGMKLSSSLKVPQPPASPDPSSSGSLLDDDNENETAKLNLAVLQPVSTASSTKVVKKPEIGKAKKEDSDDEEWNW